MSDRSYRAHENLVAPARERNELFRLVGGCVITLMLFVMMGMVYSTLEAAFLPADMRRALHDDLNTGSTPASALLNLYTFALLSIALGIMLRTLHRRGLPSLIGPVPLALRQFWQVVTAMLKLYAAFYLLSLFLPTPDAMTPTQNLAFGTWLLLLPLTLLGLLIQTSAEELVFRGYLQSQLAARFAAPTIWMILPSAVFALLHYVPSAQGDNAWLIALWAGAFGLLAADLTARAGTLGPAIAIHMVNNTAAIALTASEGYFDGVALYTLPISLSDSAEVMQWMPVEMMVLLCSWLAARLALRR